MKLMGVVDSKGSEVFVNIDYILSIEKDYSTDTVFIQFIGDNILHLSNETYKDVAQVRNLVMVAFYQN